MRSNYLLIKAPRLWRGDLFTGNESVLLISCWWAWFMQFNKTTQWVIRSAQSSRAWVRVLLFLIQLFLTDFEMRLMSWSDSYSAAVTGVQAVKVLCGAIDGFPQCCHQLRLFNVFGLQRLHLILPPQQWTQGGFPAHVLSAHHLHNETQ